VKKKGGYHEVQPRTIPTDSEGYFIDIPCIPPNAQETHIRATPAGALNIHEETKPFETEDFLKYSRKFRDSGRDASAWLDLDQSRRLMLLKDKLAHSSQKLQAAPIDDMPPKLPPKGKMYNQGNSSYRPAADDEGYMPYHTPTIV